MICLSLPTTKAYVELIGVENSMEELQYIYCKVKPQIQRELNHTIKSRCACVWMYMVANLILLCSLKTYLSFGTQKILCKKTWAILFISSFLGGHQSTHYFIYLRHFSMFFNTFFLFFMNNFCIASCFF